MDEEKPSFVPQDGQIVRLRKVEHWAYEKPGNGKNKGYATVTLETIKTSLGDETSVERREETKSYDSLTDAMNALTSHDGIKGNNTTTCGAGMVCPICGVACIRKTHHPPNEAKGIQFTIPSKPDIKALENMQPNKSQEFRNNTFIQEIDEGHREKEPSGNQNVQQLIPKEEHTHDILPSNSHKSNGVIHSPNSAETHENNHAITLERIIDTSGPTTGERGRTGDTGNAFSPDVTAEAQKADSRTYIIKLTMKGDKFRDDQDDPTNLPQEPRAKPLMAISDDSSFIKEFINHHNKYRAKHSVPPLEFSRELSTFSQNWADSLAVRNVMENSNTILGENIFYKSGFEIDPKEPVDSWYKEGLDYPYGLTDFQVKTGHFTQIVWRESRELGVGISRNPTTGTYVVAHYYPPGNIQGRFPSNILPPFNDGARG